MVTGSVPTENLPEKSHEAPKRERRVLVRKSDTPIVEKPSTSSESEHRYEWSEPQYSDIEDFTRQLEKKSVQPWQVERSYEGEIRIELHDKIHGIPMYTVVVTIYLEFTVFAFNWPVSDHHSIYLEQKRSVQYLDIIELLQRIEKSRLCEGLQEDEDVMSMATEPIGNPSTNPATIVRHTVPKAIQVEEPHFEVTLSYRSVACEILVDAEHKEELCKPCASSKNAIKRAARWKSKASATPAKSKASLASYGAEKLRATVKTTRLQVKDLEDRLQQLQQNIEQHRMGSAKA